MWKSLQTLALTALLASVVTAAPATSQGGRGAMMQDPTHAADMQVFQQLFDHRAEITRRVTLRKDGVETITESASPVVARLIQTHVESMLARVKDARPIHQRDPLFVELFRHARLIDARYEQTSGGVRVIETSQDPYAVKLVQAHAEVIGAFIANGRAEAMKNHPAPPRIP